MAELGLLFGELLGAEGAFGLGAAELGAGAAGLGELGAIGGLGELGTFGGALGGFEGAGLAGGFEGLGGLGGFGGALSGFEGLGGLGALGGLEGLGGFEAGLGGLGGFGELGGLGGLGGAELGFELGGLSGAEGIGSFEGIGGVQTGTGIGGATSAGQIAASGAITSPGQILASSALGGEGGIAEVLGENVGILEANDLGGASNFPGFETAGKFGLDQGPAMAGGISDAAGPGQAGTFHGLVGGGAGPGEIGAFNTSVLDEQFAGGELASTGQTGEPFLANNSAGPFSSFTGDALPSGFNMAAEGLSPGIEGLDALNAQTGIYGNPDALSATAQGPFSFYPQTPAGAGFPVGAPPMDIAGLEGLDLESLGPGPGTYGQDLGAGLQSQSGSLGLGPGPDALAGGGLAGPMGQGADAGISALMAGGDPTALPSTAALNAPNAAAGTSIAKAAGGSIIPQTIGGIPTNMLLPGAMLAYNLAKGPDKLSPQAQQAQQLAAQQQQFSGSQLAAAQAGNLNPAQAAAVAQFKQQAQNALYQQLAAQGIDPRTSTQWQQGMAQIEAQAQVMMQKFIDQMFAESFTAGGQSSQVLLSLSQQALAQDQAFRNSIQSALQAIGLAAGGGGIRIQMAA